MLKIFDDPSPDAEKALARIGSRGLAFTQKQHTAVNRILDHVKARGDEAVVDYTRRFDAPDYSVKDMKVGAREHAAAKSSAGSYLSAGLGPRGLADRSLSSPPAQDGLHQSRASGDDAGAAGSAG